MLPRFHSGVRAVLGAWLAACSLLACSLVAPAFERPIVTVASVQMVGGNLLKQNFRVTFEVQNPNARALPVTSLHAELKVLGEQVASGVASQPFVVPARGTSQFDMTVSANAALILLKLSQRRDQQSDVIAYEMTGAANIDLPFLHEVPFHQSGSLSLQRHP